MVARKADQRGRATIGARRSPAKRVRRTSERKQAILDCALELFSTYSFPGTSLDRIAERVGISKANLIYHFSSKEELYFAVMQRILTMWLMPLASIESSNDPIDTISNYIRVKLKYSRDYPEASRLFCLEITQGAPLLMHELCGSLRDLVATKAAILQRWIDQGQLAPVDPYHLIFSIWAITQHYADFAVQVDAVVGRSLHDEAFMDETTTAILRLVLGGIQPR